MKRLRAFWTEVPADVKYIFAACLGAVIVLVIWTITL